MACGYGLLIAVWLFTDPPGSAPDEPAHYIKAVAVGQGQLLGPRAPVGDQGLSPAQHAWLQNTSTVVTMPAGLAPDGLACNRQPSRSAACIRDVNPNPPRSLAITYVGTYEPFVYAFSGLLTRFARNPIEGLLLGRAGTAAIAVVMLALAIFVVTGDGGPSSWIGFMLVTSPMVVFLASSLTASSAEISCGLTFFAALLRLRRQPAAGTWTWMVVALAGAVLALSRSLGPAWVLLDAVAFALLAGPRSAAAVVRSGGIRSAAAVAVIGCACTATAAWELLVQPHPPLGQFTRQSLLDFVHYLPELAREMVGVFGWLDTRLPGYVYAIWLVAVGLFVALSMWTASARERVVLLVTLSGVLLVTLGVTVVLIGPTGFHVQARYVLPFAVTVPLLAAEFLSRQPAKLKRLAPLMQVGFAVPLIACQGVAWYVNARRYAVGVAGPGFLFRASEWSPAAGWSFWSVAVGAALLLILAATVIAAYPAPHTSRKLR